MILCVSGSRHFTDYSYFSEHMDRFAIIAEESYTRIFQAHHGCCRGIDTLADRWAREHDIIVVRYPADWATLGRAAGPIRNQQMIDHCDHVVAFLTDTSRGTRDTVTRARRASLPVTIYHI